MPKSLKALRQPVGGGRGPSPPKCHSHLQVERWKLCRPFRKPGRLGHKVRSFRAPAGRNHVGLTTTYSTTRLNVWKHLLESVGVLTRPSRTGQGHGQRTAIENVEGTLEQRFPVRRLPPEKGKPTESASRLPTGSVSNEKECPPRRGPPAPPSPDPPAATRTCPGRRTWAFSPHRTSPTTVLDRPSALRSPGSVPRGFRGRGVSCPGTKARKRARQGGGTWASGGGAAAHQLAPNRTRSESVRSVFSPLPDRFRPYPSSSPSNPH